MFRLHPEGRRDVLFVVVLMAAVAFAPRPFGYLPWAIGMGAALALALMIVNFFRYPRRTVSAQPGDVIAPCDGKVVVIEQVTDATLGPAIQLSIFMSPLDVHVNYSPVQGVIEAVDYHKGKYLAAWNPKSSTDNEQTRWRLRASGGQAIGMKQIAGALARRIRWYGKPGQPVQAGQEVGFIKFGSRVDLLLPLSTQVLVKLGDRTVGGETVIARL